MTKKVLGFVLVLILAVFGMSCQKKTETSGGSTSSTGGEPEGHLTIWTGVGNFYINGGISDYYTKIHPKVTFDVMPTPSNDLFEKLQQTLAAGGELPDMLDYESSWWKRVNEMDLRVHLNDYGIKAEDYYDFALGGMLDSKGNIQGINYAINFFAIAIKTEMAKKYLGTTNRDDIMAMFSTVDKMIETGQRVRAQTNNQINLFGAWNFFNFWFNFRVGGANENAAGEFELTKNHLPIYQNQLKIWRSGIVTYNAEGTPGYINQMTDDVNIGMLTCTGDIFYVFMPRDPEGKVDLMLIPVPADIGNAQFGGTSIGVMKTSKNIDLAVNFVKYFLHDIDGVKWVRDNLGNFVPLKAAYDDPATLGPYTYKNFGDFDYGAFYLSQAPGVPRISYSVNDSVVRQAMSLAQQEMLVNNNITADQLMQMEINEVKSRLPDIVIK